MTYIKSRYAEKIATACISLPAAQIVRATSLMRPLVGRVAPGDRGHVGHQSLASQGQGSRRHDLRPLGSQLAREKPVFRLVAEHPLAIDFLDRVVDGEPDPF